MFIMNKNAVFLVVFVLLNNAVFGQRTCITPDGRYAQCIPIRGCQALLDILTTSPKPLSPSVSDYLKKHHCGFDRDGPLVCCNDNISPTTSTTTTSRPTRIPDISNNNGNEDISKHRNINLLPTNICGPLFTQKLSGGNKTDLFEYPWMALLEYETRQGLSFLCGGSLISERYVLTAAHCVAKLRSPNRLVSVRLGEHDIISDVDCETIDNERICAEPVQDIPVEDIIAHPSYDKPKWSNDVAVVRLSRSADMTPESVRPICLPITTAAQSVLPKRVSISGWGTTENQRTSNELLQASLPIVPNDVCQTFFKRTVRLTSSQMCAGGETGIDSCKGDSGGPLVYPANIRGTKMVQFGIISAGLESCSKTSTFPGIYVRVSSYMPWILDQMRT